MNAQQPGPEDVTICHCSGTTLSDLLCLAGQGLDMDAISRRTGARSGCGGCEWEIARVLSGPPAA